MERARKVLVLGGTGFIGRHAVTALLASDASVTIGTRRPARPDPALPAPIRDCPRSEVHFEHMTHPRAWETLVPEYEVILNCVGILRPRDSGGVHASNRVRTEYYCNI